MGNTEVIAREKSAWDRLRARIRFVRRLTLLAAWTLPLFAVRLGAMTVAIFSQQRERRIRSALFRFWAKGALHILGVRLSVEGTPPCQPFLLVSNHLSYLDVIVYSSVLGCIFVSMIEVSGWPLVGFITRCMNTLYIDRGRLRDAARVNELMRNVYNTGEGLMMFPESTTGGGASVMPFKPALLEPAATNAWPVYFATIHYATPPGAPPANRAVCWVDNVPFGEHAVGLLSVPSIDARIRFGSRTFTNPDRKALAIALRGATAEQLEPYRSADILVRDSDFLRLLTDFRNQISSNRIQAAS